MTLNKSRMRLSLTLILLSCVSIVTAQGYNKNSGINEAEKKRLESQFKELKTFYINDDGLVVYHPGAEPSVDTQNNDTNNNADYTQAESPVSAQETGESEERNLIEDYQPTRSSVTSASGVVSLSKKAVNHNDSKTIDIPAAENTVVDTQETGIEAEKNTVETKVANTKSENKDEKKVASTEKKSIFDKSKQKERQYKTLEEAALAAQALLDNLKKEQSHSNNSRSMSSRLAQGAKSTLRKKPLSSSSPYDPYASIDDQSAQNKSMSISTTLEGEYISEFGDEPTYYINGQEADKSEVDKLRKKDIVSKEVRVRNTISKNPNGEVWYEVR